MIINFRANRDEEGWAEAQRFVRGRVTVDGTEIKDAWYVDTDAGIVQYYETTLDHVTGSRRRYYDGSGHLASRRISGLVQVYETKEATRPWMPPPQIGARPARVYDLE